METKFKDVAHLYLGCKVEYVGILNGKEIGKYQRNYNDTHSSHGIFQGANFNPPAEIVGMRIGYLKRINWNKKSGNVYEIGVFHHGLKKYYPNSLNEVKPILYPLSAMTDEQKQRRDEFGTIGWNSVEKQTENIQLAVQLRQSHEVAYLLSQHFDLFGLIKSGQAIDATTI